MRVYCSMYVHTVYLPQRVCFSVCLFKCYCGRQSICICQTVCGSMRTTRASVCVRNACLSVSVINVYVKMGVYYYNVQVRKYVCMIVFDEGVCCIGKDMLVAIGVRCDVCVQ